MSQTYFDLKSVLNTVSTHKRHTSVGRSILRGKSECLYMEA